MMDIKYITILYPGRAKCEVFQTNSAPSGLNRSGIYFASSPFSYYIKIFTNLLITTGRASQNICGQSFFPIGWTPRHWTAKTNNRIHQEHNPYHHLDQNSGYFCWEKKMDCERPLPSLMKRNPNFGHSFFSMAPSIKHQNMIFYSTKHSPHGWGEHQLPDQRHQRQACDIK